MQTEQERLEDILSKYRKAFVNPYVNLRELLYNSLKVTFKNDTMTLYKSEPFDISISKQEKEDFYLVEGYRNHFKSLDSCCKHIAKTNLIKAIKDL